VLPCLLLLLGLPGASAQSGVGAIEGRVTFVGSPPSAVVTQDGGSQPALYVDPSGGLRYAVVYLPDAPGRGTRPPAAAIVNQRQFIFEPQVLAVRAGQTVQFTNDDPANHNVRSNDSNSGNTFNIDTATGAAASNVHRFAATASDQPVQLSCDIHPWMAAWVYVFTHDRFAVTTADGSFRISNVPPGRYRIAIRQPSGRLSRDLAVDVRPGETTRLDVRFTPADVGMPVR
jgi:plastocyanin